MPTVIPVPTSHTHHTNPGNAGDVTTLIPFPGHADYDTGTNRSTTVDKLANVRTATIVAPTAEGGGLSSVASDLSIEDITPELTWEMRSRLRDQGHIVRTDSGGTTIAGFYTQPDAEIRGRLDDGTRLEVYEKWLGARTFTANITPTGLTNITPALSAAQVAQLVGGTVGGSGPTATTFSGAGTAGTYRAKVATVTTTTVTFSAGTSAAGTLTGNVRFYAVCAFPNATGTWNVSISSYGKDISYALADWMTGTIGLDDYTDKSGTELDETWIEFAADTVYELNYGQNLGLRSGFAGKYDKDGRFWPTIKPHAWQWTQWHGPDGLERAHWPVWRQADNTVNEQGARSITGDCVAGGQTVSNVTPPVGPNDRERLLGPCPLASGGGWTDPPRVSGKKTGGVAGLFVGGQKNNSGDIIDVSLDGTTITLAPTSSAVETRTAADITLNVPVQEPGRENLEMAAFAGPNSSGSGASLTERGSMTHDCVVENVQIIGGNGTTRGDATDSRYTPREFWHAFAFKGCDTITVRNVSMRNLWGDFLFYTGSLQAEISAAQDAGVMSDSVTVEDCVGIGCGRHANTWQGQTGTIVRRSTFVGITRLFIDSENTSVSPRILDTLVEDCAVEYGSGVFRIGGEPKFSCEPPFALAGCTVDPADHQVIVVPADMVDTSYLGGYVTGNAGIPPLTIAVRRLSPTRIELSDECTPWAGTATLEFGYGSTFGKHTFTRCDILTKTGFQITGDNVPAAGRAYFEFDTVLDSDHMTNVVFLPREDGLTFTTADVDGRTVSHLAGSTGATNPPGSPGNQALFPYNDLAATEITPGELSVEKITQAGLHKPCPAFLSTRANFNVNTTFTANSRTLTVGTNTFHSYDRGDLLSESAGKLRADTIIGGFKDAPGLLGSKSALLSKPAQASGSTLTTYQGKWRGWAAIVRDNFWNGWVISECRNCGTGTWPGGNAGVGYDEGDGPAILFNAYSSDYLVEKCYLPAATSTPTTYTGSTVAAGSFTGTRTVANAATFLTGGGYAQVATTTGLAVIHYTGKATGQLTGCTWVAGTGNVVTGAAIANAPNPMVGIYTGTGHSTVGMDGRGTMSNNRFPGSFHNQILQPPTVTVSLALSFDDPDATRPYATVIGTRSDAAPLKGTVTILRNGDLAGAAIFTGTSNTVTTEIWDDSEPGAVWTAQWAGSWDTLGANDVAAPPPTTTATTLGVSPSSPQEQGVALTLTATVTPDPTIGVTDTITFKDGATTIGTAVATAGVATLVLPSGLTAGVHSLTAVFAGNDGYATSTSSAVPFTTTTPPVDQSTSTVLTAFVTGFGSIISGGSYNVGSELILQADVTPTPSGGTVTFTDDGTPAGTGSPFSVSGVSTLTVTLTEGVHVYTADYDGTDGYLPSTSGTFTITGIVIPAEPPAVIATTPEDGETGVARDLEQITVTWDQEITDPVVTLRTAQVTFTLVPLFDGEQDLDLDPSGQTWVWRLAATLQPGSYQIIVSDAVGGDIYGSHMTEPYVATFTTVPSNELRPTGLLVAR